MYLWHLDYKRCHGEVLPWLCWSGVLNVTCVWMFVSSSGLGEFSALILLNGFPVPLVFTFLVLRVLGFSLPWTLWLWSFTFAYWCLYILLLVPSPSRFSFFCFFKCIVRASHYAFLVLFCFIFNAFVLSASLLTVSFILLSFFISLADFFFCIDDFLCRSCIWLIFPLSIHFQVIDFVLFFKKTFDIFIWCFTYLRMFPSF